MTRAAPVRIEQELLIEMQQPFEAQNSSKPNTAALQEEADSGVLSVALKESAGSLILKQIEVKSKSTAQQQHEGPTSWY